MTSEDNHSSRQPLDHDPLDDFEPVAVPRKRLWVLAGLCFLLVLPMLMPVVPVGGDEGYVTLAECLEGPMPFSDEDHLLDRIWVGTPAVAALIALLVAVQLAGAPMITFAPAGRNAFSAILCALALLWIGSFTYTWVLEAMKLGWPTLSEWEIWTFLALFYGLTLPATTALVLMPVGSGRAVMAIISAAALNLTVAVIWIMISVLLERMDMPLPSFFSLFDVPGFSFFCIFGFIALAAIAIGLSCVWVYRRQRKLEKQFEQALRERERKRAR